MLFNPVSLHDFGEMGYRTRNNYLSEPPNRQSALETMSKIEQYLFESRTHNRDGSIVSYNLTGWNRNDLFNYASEIKEKHRKANTSDYPQISKIFMRVHLVLKLREVSIYDNAQFEYFVKKIVELEGKIETQNESYLRLALSRKCFGLAQNLLKKRANPNFISRTDAGLTMLRYALNNTRMVNVLIQKGADVNQVDFHGRTILIEACRENKIEVMRYLLNSGANVNYVGIDGSALRVAIKVLSEQAVVLLAGAHVDVDEGAAREIVKLATLRETPKTIHFIQALAQNGLVDCTLKEIALDNGNLRTVEALKPCRKIA